MASSFYLVSSLQLSPVGGASRAITSKTTSEVATTVTSAGILRHIKEQALSVTSLVTNISNHS